MPHPEAYRFGCDPEEKVKELLYERTIVLSFSLSSLLSVSLFLLSFCAGRDAFVEAYQRDTGAARKRRVTRVISTMETEPRARAVPGGVGVSALGSKVRDYNIPGMPFRVHQFGTPVPSLRSSRRRVRRERESFLPSCRPSFSLPARCGPFQTSAKLRGSASRLCFRSSPRFPLPPALMLRARKNERAVRSFPGRTRYPGIGKCLLTFLRSLFRLLTPVLPLPFAYVNCTKSFLELHKYGSFVYFGISCYILYSVNLCNLKYICGISDEMQRGTVIKKNLWFLWRYDLQNIIKSSMCWIVHTGYGFFSGFLKLDFITRDYANRYKSKLQFNDVNRISQSCIYLYAVNWITAGFIADGVAFYPTALSLHCSVAFYRRAGNLYVLARGRRCRRCRQLSWDSWTSK